MEVMRDGLLGAGLGLAFRTAGALLDGSGAVTNLAALKARAAERAADWFRVHKQMLRMLRSYVA